MPVADIARAMFDAYPSDLNIDRDVLVRCIEACHDCEQACTQCADADLTEQGKLEQLAKCIRLNLDCADICLTTGRVVSRRTEYDANVTRRILQACAQACKSCGDECEHHAQEGMGEHFGVCAEQCRRCEQACDELVSVIS